jgi:hypothetical protein
MTADLVKVLAFDVFGTVVDVPGSLSRVLSEYGARRGLQPAPGDSFDVVAQDFIELAARLGTRAADRGTPGCTH